MRAERFFAVLLGGLLAVSCAQDPLFNKIVSETAPLKPLIEGSPTNMVIFDNKMYVASGRLHWYAKAAGAEKPQWDLGEHRIPQPGGTIISSLAVTRAGGERLYALCRDGTGVNATLRYIEPNSDTWTKVESTTAAIQEIYADPDSDMLFAGVGTNTYSIRYLDKTNNRLEPLIGNTALLSGVVFKDGTYYLSTRGGIFRVDATALAKPAIDPADVQPLRGGSASDNMFMSMIKLVDSGAIIAVERDGGALYEVREDFFRRMRYPLRSPVELTAAYTGRETVSYQWYRDDNEIEDATASRYTPEENGSYTVTIRAEGKKPKTSAAFIVPAHPNDLNGNITISPRTDFEIGKELTAAYTDLEIVSYQWYKDGTAIPGAASNKYTPTETGNYTITVRAEGYNTKTSAVITISDDPDDLNGIITINPNVGGQISIGRYATEAYALWEDRYDPGNKLLIIGIQGGLFSTTTSSHTYGYTEFELEGDSVTARNERLKSVDDLDRYTAGLGIQPIKHLFQAPQAIDPDMTFFASTQNKGLWSYRDRPENGGWQWNAEE